MAHSHYDRITNRRCRIRRHPLLNFAILQKLVSKHLVKHQIDWRCEHIIVRSQLHGHRVAKIYNSSDTRVRIRVYVSQRGLIKY